LIINQQNIYFNLSHNQDTLDMIWINCICSQGRLYVFSFKKCFTWNNYVLRRFLLVL